MIKGLNVFLVLLIFQSGIAHSQEDSLYFKKELADSLGADDYGMRLYTFVLLSEGGNTEKDSLKRQTAFTGHLKNIERLSDKGEIVLAGPFGSNEHEYRGLFIFKNSSEEAVKEMLMTDPAIKNDYLTFEIISWYGSAALPLYQKAHKVIQKKKF